MPVFLALFGFLTPIVLGNWIGTRARYPAGAFFLGWMMTPVMGCVTALVMMTMMTDPRATWVAVELPIAGLALGLLSGGIAAFLVHQRQATTIHGSPESATKTPDAPVE